MKPNKGNNVRQINERIKKKKIEKYLIKQKTKAIKF